MRKPKNPTPANSRCTIGFPNALGNFPPSLPRNEIKVDVMEKMIENEMATAMNTGIGMVGAERKFRAFKSLGRMVRSVVSMWYGPTSN
jgi:hypothetical protein